MSESLLQLEPPFDQPLFARLLKPAFDRNSPRALSLPSALSPATRAALRALARSRWTLFDLADRGRYRYIELRDSNGGDSNLPTVTADLRAACAPLLEQLRQFAMGVGGLELRTGPARLLAFSRGDYSLRLDDARTRPAPNLLEVTLDLSAAPTEAAAIIYSDGPWDHLPIAQFPGQISLVARGPQNSRCDRYRNAFSGSFSFVPLRAAFPLAES